MLSFTAEILIIGINPYVAVPEDVLNDLFRQAGKSTGPIPIRGTLNGKGFKQTLVKYKGAWRLYLNTPMRQNAGIDVGDDATLEIEFDPEPRLVPIHPKLARALSRNKEAKAAFEKLPLSRQKEILRYLNSMKTDESLTRNIEKVIQHLLGEKPKGLSALMRRKA
ncbi:MAG TPA: YdeI/OmpD-associated family protein [Anaerolineales bacterium]|nr:YdeI/OmpD-associated family protein [Anaerolineales bacterium]